MILVSVSIDNVATPIVALLSGYLQHKLGPKVRSIGCCCVFFCSPARGSKGSDARRKPFGRKIHKARSHSFDLNSDEVADHKDDEQEAGNGGCDLEEGGGGRGGCDSGGGGCDSGGGGGDSGGGGGDSGGGD